MTRSVSVLVRVAISSAVAAALTGGPGRAPVSAQLGGAESVVEYGGAAGLGLALRRLGTTKRVLMIGAHPDDENTAVLSALALGEGADAAYISLTRGEGGQNLIGGELQEGLGLIRSEELLAARRLDGATQYFTRAYDFGFSRSADETFGHWPRDEIFADLVEVVRRFRPDILISVFSGTPADGHGHHQVAGILARDAFRAAGDASELPEQIVSGVREHQPTYLFQAVWRPRGDEPISMSTGDYDPLLGRSHFQVAMASRSRHRSQDMGQAEPAGPQHAAIAVLAGEYPASGVSLFAGIDTTLSMIAEHGAGGRTSAAPPAIAEALRRYEAQVVEAQRSFNPLAPDSITPILDRARAELLAADSMTERAGADALRRAIEIERHQLDVALWTAAGLVLDAQVDDARMVPGQEIGLTLSLWNGGPRPVDVVALEPALPPGWNALPEDTEARDALPPGAVVRRRFTVRVPAGEPATEPYYLREARDADLYRWPQDPTVRALPFEPPPLNATARVRVGEHVVDRTVEATYVEVDRAQGERRIPVLVVPAINVAVSPTFTVLPMAPVASGTDENGGTGAGGRATSRAITVELTSEATGSVTGTLRVETPTGWHATPPSVPVTLEQNAGHRELQFSIEPPETSAPGEYRVRVVFEAASGARYDRGYTVIEYPHTRPRTLYRDAAIDIAVVPVQVAADLDVGYIEGAGDAGALALRQIGVAVTPLDADALAAADLSRFDAIVLGIRTFEVRPDVIAYNDRLLDYARDGGTVIVQYNQYEYAEGGFAPYPLTIARPHGRVTDEAAPVRLLDPSHPLLSVPNAIATADFDGWVQERGLYFADTWDDRYTPLLEMADPDMEPLRGALLAAGVGEGWYVYTGLSLFRQLPQRVPGAYRILANLVSLGRPVEGQR